MSKQDLIGGVVIGTAAAIVILGRVVWPVLRWLRSRWEVRALDKLRTKDTRQRMPHVGPVTVYDWTAYGNHLGGCTACTADKPHCDNGVQLWRATMKTATVVSGGGR